MKTVIITGASSGIGKEFAVSIDQKFSPDCMWLIGRHTDRLRDTAALLKCSAEIVTLDLAESESYEALENKLKKEKPQIQFLVNAAGFGKFGSVWSLHSEDAENIINVNIKALTMITKMCLPFMAEKGSIINMSSASAFVPLPYFNIYSASKAYVLNFSQALSFELRKTDISVIAVCPYWVASDFIATAQDSPDGYAVNNFLFITYPFKVVRKALSDIKFSRTVSLSGCIPVMIKYLSKVLSVRTQNIIWNVTRKITLPDSQIPPVQWLGQEYPDRLNQ